MRAVAETVIIAKAITYHAEQAKMRQAEQARRNQPQSQKVEPVPPLEKAKARDQAGKQGGTAPGRKSLVEPVPQVKARDQAGKQGGRGNKASDNVRGFYGNQATYLLARLKRDRPDILGATKAGF